MMQLRVEGETEVLRDVWPEGEIEKMVTPRPLDRLRNSKRRRIGDHSSQEGRGKKLE